MLNNFKKVAHTWRGVLFTVPTVFTVLTALRLLGWLQPAELAALDMFFQMRPTEPPDKRFVIVAVEEADIQKLNMWPTSDRILAKLLNNIKQQRPTVIGLELYRDIPVEPGHQELVNVFKTTPNLIGIEKVIGDTYNPKIAPPPELKKRLQTSSNDIIIDGDGVIRRGILFPYADDNPSMPSLGLAVALHYLKKQFEITPVGADGGWMKLGKTVFMPFEENDGGYVRADASYYQILLNYRGRAKTFSHVLLTDVLLNRIPPNLMRDRIVLIGAYAPSLNDRFYTPYSRNLEGVTPIRTPGVEIQANLASQIISAVLDNRPLIQVRHDSLEYLWIGLWINITAIWIWSWRRVKNEILFFLITIAGVACFVFSIFGAAYLSFLVGWWIPLVPPLLGIVGAAITGIGYNYVDKLKEANAELRKKIKENLVLYSTLEEHNRTLEAKVESRTQELKNKNYQLEETLKALRDAQDQIIAQEKLALWGTITLGVAHEIQNPLNLVNNYATICIEYCEEMQEYIEFFKEDKQDRSAAENHKQLIGVIANNLQEIIDAGQRIDRIIKSMLAQVREESATLEPYDINALVFSAIKLVYNSQKLSFAGDYVRIETDFDDSIGKVEIIPQDINRALINILNNAYYAVQAKKKIMVNDFVPTILVKTRKLGKQVEICIQDNGTGIPEEIQDKIFKFFFTTKPTGEGTGLGLSLTHDIIVGQHKGDIKLTSSDGMGATFTIILPLAQNWFVDKSVR